MSLIDEFLDKLTIGSPYTRPYTRRIKEDNDEAIRFVSGAVWFELSFNGEGRLSYATNLEGIPNPDERATKMLTREERAVIEGTDNFFNNPDVQRVISDIITRL